MEERSDEGRAGVWGPVGPVGPQSSAGGAGNNAREAGWDLARAFAIVMMVLINFQLMLAAPPPETGLDHGEQILRWLVHVPSGRSSSLFVVLSGVGFSLLTKKARERRAGEPYFSIELRVALRTMLLRVVFLFALGNALLLVWSIDILHFYACYLLLATLLFLRTPGWAVLSMGALATIGAVVIDMALPGRAELPYLSPLGLTLDLFLDGVHPVLPWFGFVAYGAWLGRRDLSEVTRRRAFLRRAALLVLVTELGSLAVATAVLRVPALAFLAPHLGVLSTSWDPAPLFVVSACGTATVFITLAHELTARFDARLPVRALVHTGQLALSIYLTHAIVGVVLPRFFFGWGHALSVAVVTAYWLGFVLTVIVLATLYRRVLPRGPLEWVMRTLTSWRFASERATDPTSIVAEAGAESEARATPAARASTLSWILIAVGTTALLAGRVVGLGVGPSDEVFDLDAEGASTRSGELTLLHPRRTVRFQTSRLGHVVIETRSGLDLYLELARVDGEALRYLAEDDDSGEDLDARIDTSLAPGTYTIIVRPYGATTGPFVLSITPSP